MHKGSKNYLPLLSLSLASNKYTSLSNFPVILDISKQSLKRTRRFCKGSVGFVFSSTTVSLMKFRPLERKFYHTKTKNLSKIENKAKLKDEQASGHKFVLPIPKFSQRFRTIYV